MLVRGWAEGGRGKGVGPTTADPPPRQHLKHFRWAPLTGSPFTLLVRPASGGQGGSPCDAVAWPAKQCTSIEPHGRYVPCDPARTSACLASGWAWVPQNCHYKMYSAAEVAAVPRPVWILYLGSSVMRGMFYSTLDMMLGPQAANLSGAGWFKCWNRLELTLGSMRVTYQDFRPHVMLLGKHGPRPREAGNYTAWRKELLGQFGAEEYGGRAGPDVVVLEVSKPWDVLTPEFDTSWVPTVAAWFGDAWTGRLVAVPRLRDPWAELYLQPLKDSVPASGDARVEADDWQGVDLPFLHDLELPPTTRYTPHYHRACDEHGRHVCSVVTDMTAQIVLNIALSGGVGGAARHAPDGATPKPGFTFCLKCPARASPNIAPWFMEPDNDPPECFVNHVPQDLAG